MKPAFDPARLRLLFRATFCRGKSDTQIPPDVIDELERRGIDSVRALLASMSDGYSGTGRNTTIQLGGGLKIRRDQMEDWLKDKAAANARWAKVGTVAAIIAAVLAVLPWVYPPP
jgi:hypothetical protein